MLSSPAALGNDEGNNDASDSDDDASPPRAARAARRRDAAPDVLGDLLGDLKTEPTDDSDAARRFQLYEKHAETVATVRQALFSFWAGAQADVPNGAPRAAIEAALRACDAAEHQEINLDDPR